MQSEVVIVSACRTPFGKCGGSLKDFNPVTLGARVMRDVVERASYKGLVDEVY